MVDRGEIAAIVREMLEKSELATKVRQLQGRTPPVRGLVLAAGTAFRGSGFTSSRTGTGTYVIVYERPFVLLPIPVLSAFNVPAFVTIGAESVDGCTVLTKDGAGALADAAFTFAVFEDS